MKKTLKLWLALALALVTGVQAWAQEEEPKVWNRTTTLGFVYSGLAEDAKTAVSEADKIFYASTLEYVKELTAAKHVYNGGSNYDNAGFENAIRLGNATYPSGELSFTLATPVKAQSIRIRAKQYSASENKITVNGQEIELSSGWAYYTVNLVDEKNPDGQDISAISIVSTKRAYIYNIRIAYSTSEMTPVNRSISIYSPNDIGEYLDNYIKTQKENGYEVKNLTINLNGGNYTTSKPIIAYRNLTINGNNSIVDASPLKKLNFKGDKDTIQSFIQMADVTWPKEELNGKSAMYIEYVNINDLQVDSVKSFFFYDSNKKYVFNNFNVYNCKIMLKTAETTEAAFEFKAGGALAFNIQNSTVYQVGEKNVNYFTKYHNSIVPDNGVEDYEGSNFFTYRNNTFYNVAASGQWHNGGRIAQKCKLMTVNIEKNIWANCAANLLRRMFGGSKKITDFTKESVLDKNTFGKYDAEGKWTVEDQGSYGNNSDLTTDPEFADVEKGDFHLGKKTLQNGFQAGDAEWIFWGNGNQYVARQYQADGTEEEFLNGGSFTLNGSWNYYCYENNIVQININPYVDYYEFDNDGNIINTIYNYQVKDVQVYIDADWGDAKAPRRGAPGLLETVEVKKMKDNQYYFFMPRANVRVKVIYERIVKNWWISNIDDQIIDQNFEGEVKPEIVVADNNMPLYDENNNFIGYKTLVEGKDYTIEYSNNTQATTWEKPAIVTIKGMGNYAGEAKREFQIIRNLMAVDTEEEVGADGLVDARVVSEENKTCEITKISTKTGEVSITIPTTVLGYEVVSIADEATKNQDLSNITDVYIPALEAGQSIYFAENALLPKGFTHPSNMFNVHVEDVTMLDDYANMPGLKPFAKYSRLMAEVTIGESAYATFSTGIPVQFEENAQVSIVKAHSATQVTKQVVKGNKVPKNTGVLLFGKPGKYTVYAINENTPFTSADYDGNLLEAVTAPTAFPLNDDDAAANSYFVLKNGAFYAIADNTDSMVPACKAILKVAKGEAAAAAPMLEIFTGELTGISAVKADLKNAEIFDLNGRKVSNAQKGMFIVNGKKVVIK